VTQPEVDAVDVGEEFAEGRIFTALHKVRERSPALRKKLLAARHKVGPLSCDACDSGPKVVYADLIEAGFEAHHTEPLATAGRRTTRVSDLALLCATCHRLIHRAMHLRRRWVGVEELRALVEGGAPPGATT
jgi:5-methylcytosine-specific restriction protein A